jgi:hypothetical protein
MIACDPHLPRLSFGHDTPHPGQSSLHVIRNECRDRHVHPAEMTKPRRVDRLPNVHPEHEQIDQLRAPLRLHRAAHQTEAHVRRVRAAIRSRR